MAKMRKNSKAYVRNIIQASAGKTTQGKATECAAQEEVRRRNTWYLLAGKMPCAWWFTTGAGLVWRRFFGK